MENKYGQMALNIKEIGKKIKHQVKVFSYMPMAICIKVNGKMIRHMDMESLLMQRPMLNIKATGKMI
jgi:hypothetical protein